MSVLCLLCLGHVCRSDNTASLTIRFSGHAGGFWGRYVISDGVKARAGWTKGADGKDAYPIEGIAAGAKTRFAAIFYAPGCAIQTVDLRIEEARPYQYSFVCEPVSQTEIEGIVERTDRFYGRDDALTIEAKYVAGWAAAFLGYDDKTTVNIPLGSEGRLAAGGRFRLMLPDLSQSGRGEIRIWARSVEDHAVVAQLRLSSKNLNVSATQLGGIPLETLASLPKPAVFTPCIANPAAGPHDEYGFALRPGWDDACGNSGAK